LSIDLVTDEVSPAVEKEPRGTSRPAAIEGDKAGSVVIVYRLQSMSGKQLRLFADLSALDKWLNERAPAAAR
jgi:hypothetical protein